MARPSRRSERGAILINVAIGMMVFIGVTAFVVDYGVMWVGRGQAQNAADAGALAGAVAMAFDANGWTDRTPTGPARAAALQMAHARTSSGARRRTWTSPRTCSSRTSPRPCVRRMPTGTRRAFAWTSTATRREAIRCPRSSASPFGLANQGVRATATARVAVANASDCLKPWAIPDKWLDSTT